GLRRHADVPGRNLSALEYQQGRDGGDAVVGGQFLVGVHVYLADLEVAGQGLDDRLHGPARRAPGGQKSDQHRLAGLQDFLLPYQLAQDSRFRTHFVQFNKMHVTAYTAGPDWERRVRLLRVEWEGVVAQRLVGTDGSEHRFSLFERSADAPGRFPREQLWL